MLSSMTSSLTGDFIDESNIIQPAKETNSLRISDKIPDTCLSRTTKRSEKFKNKKIKATVAELQNMATVV